MSPLRFQAHQATNFSFLLSSQLVSCIYRCPLSYSSYFEHFIDNGQKIILARRQTVQNSVCLACHFPALDRQGISIQRPELCFIAHHSAFFAWCDVRGIPSAMGPVTRRAVLDRKYFTPRLLFPLVIEGRARLISYNEETLGSLLI